MAVEAETGTTLVDEDYEDVADSAIVWWRDDDGDVDDLTDLLMDAQANLDGAGLIWVLTPKARTTGAVQAPRWRRLLRQPACMRPPPPPWGSTGAVSGSPAEGAESLQWSTCVLCRRMRR